MKLIYKIALLFAFAAIAFSAKAQGSIAADADSATIAKMQNVKISLLTCGGYDEVWALYGHSALRIEMLETGEDYAVNYGLFDFNQPNFIGRFMFGKCDYLMGLVPFEAFLHEFSAKGAAVFQQEINLTLEEKASVLAALYENSLPENCQYRYNFFYDNCATRPRDIILNNIPDRIVYTNEIDQTKTFRQIIHENNEQKPWCRLGNDLLLGVNADEPTTRADQQFLPSNLERDFSAAQFVDSAGNKRPVVLSSKWILQGKAAYTQEFPLSPTACACIILALAVALTLIEYWQKKRFWIADTILLTLCGILGVVLFLMIFSEHPTVSLNCIIFAFNPLLLVFLWRIIKELRRKRLPVVCLVYMIFVTLAMSYTSKDILPIGPQCAPEGFHIVCLALLVRLIRRLSLEKRGKFIHKGICKRT
ncbi:MAG: DUF4105 domain-containing protein [Bacteroidaceae bacterium]|nr:DUF4105 domain-containing protein [Bacteroidaceae bacterium]